MALAVPHDQGQRDSVAAVHFEAQRPGLAGRIALEGLAQVPVQFRIIGLPKPVSGLHPIEVHGPRAEGQFDEPVAQRPHTVDAAAFFREIGAPGVEADSVTGLERSFQAQADRVGPHRRHLAEVHPALLAEPRMGQRLVVDAPEPSRVEPAAEGHFQFVAGLGGGNGPGVRLSRCVARSGGGDAVQRPPIDAGDAGHVFGRLEAPFDLERAHPGLHQVGQHLESRQVLG